MIHIATPVVYKNVVTISNFDYKVTSIDIGLTSRTQEIDEFQGSVMTILHIMDKDQATKKELKAQVVELTAFIQQLVTPSQKIPVEMSTLAILSMEEVIKVEIRENWTKVT